MILGAGLALSGCASQPAADEGPHPVWPPAPAEARIRHERSFSGGEQLVKPSFFDAVGTMLTGTRRQPLGEPNSIAVEAGRLLVISDQMLQGIHVFDLASGRANFLDRIDHTYFVSPVGVAICGQYLAVSDSALKRVDLITRDGKPIGRIDKPGGFVRPTGLAFDSRTQHLYVVDTGAGEVCVFDLRGALVRTIGRPGGDIGEFNFPTHVCRDAAGRLYVTDSMNFRVQVFDVNDQYLFELGRHGDASGHFGVPKGIAVDSQGHIYVVDSYFSNVQIFDGQGRFLLHFGEAGKVNGQFDVPTGLAIDSADRIYVGDSQNHRVQIFQYLGGASNEPQAKP
jgi:DNA-binding beta-propeller fold protein YncE